MVGGGVVVIGGVVVAGGVVVGDGVIVGVVVGCGAGVVVGVVVVSVPLQDTRAIKSKAATRKTSPILFIMLLTSTSSW